MFDIDCTVQLKGNIKIDFRSCGGLGSDKEVLRITFNTAFIGTSNRLFLTRTEISPENNHKDFKQFPDDFWIEVLFDDFCQTCKPHITPIEDLCMECKACNAEEIRHWKTSYEILDRHERTNPRTAL